MNVDSKPGGGGRISGRLAGKGAEGGREAGREKMSPNLMMFLISRKKAFLAEVQKLVP